MEIINLISKFDRETEVLEVFDDYMVYAVDTKRNMKNHCVIEKYNFQEKKRQPLLELEDTRIFESFNTYSQLKEYFYAVNVNDDYSVRMRKIDKKSWTVIGEMTIEAIKEIVSIYPLNEQYLIIVEEVETTPEIREQYQLKPGADKYSNITYLYDTESKSKYPLTQGPLNTMIEQLSVVEAAGQTYLVLDENIMEARAEEKKARKRKKVKFSGLYYIGLDQFVDQVISRKNVDMKVIKKGDSEGYVRLLKITDQGQVIFRWKKYETKIETVTAFSLDGESYEDLFAGEIPDNGECFFDLEERNIYFCADTSEETEYKTIVKLLQQTETLTYRARYGEFMGDMLDQGFITTYFEVDNEEEDGYHQYIAVHDLEKKEISRFEGKYIRHRDKVIIMRTFLIL